MKTNEQFARKCISNIPRLRNRTFRMVFTVKRTVRVMDIKPASDDQLKNFFETFQWFLIDNDLLATPVMGADNDLFVNFNLFQFHTGNYAHVAPVDFMAGLFEEFYSHPLVVHGMPTQPLTTDTPLDDDTILRRLPVPMKYLRTGGEAAMKVRRYIPGPTGFNQRHTYHTTAWSGWGRDSDNARGFSLANLADEKELVVIMDHKYPGSVDNPTWGDRDLSFALTIPEFLAYAERKRLEISPVSFDGVFSIKRKPD